MPSICSTKLVTRGHGERWRAGVIAGRPMRRLEAGVATKDGPEYSDDEKIGTYGPSARPCAKLRAQAS